MKYMRVVATSQWLNEVCSLLGRAYGGAGVIETVKRPFANPVDPQSSRKAELGGTVNVTLANS